MSDNEKLLLKKAREGDIESFEALVRKYQGFIYNIALRMFANKEDASDIAQEALIKAYKNLKRFNERSLFSTWLYRITMNTCIDEQRKRQKQKIIKFQDKDNDDTRSYIENIKDKGLTPEEAALKKERMDALKKAIQSLPDKHKSIIILRDIKGMDYESIGEVLGISNGTVKSRISRARQRLKELLLDEKELFNNINVKSVEKGVR
jgi:RNA polymerase sigma-70 factor (ECF subfamily)